MPLWTAPEAASKVTSGVVAVYTTGKTIGALKDDGSFVAWGHSTQDIASGVTKVVASSKETWSTNIAESHG